jgi:predicted acetyltransferase
MKQRGTNLSMLRGTANLYHRLGWRTALSYMQVCNVAGSDELSSYRIRPADFDREIPVMKAIHNEYSERFNGPFIRDDDYYWRFWVRMECRNLWMIEDVDARIIGYVSFRYDEGCLTIHEFCVLPPYDDIFDQVALKLILMTNHTATELKFDSLIPSRLSADRFETNESGMYMLLRPLKVGDEMIDSTEAFVERLRGIAEKSRSGQNPISNVLFWGIDSF